MLRSFALVAVASGAALFAGCGGGDDGASQARAGGDAKALLVDTFKPSGADSKVKSAQVALTAAGKLTGTKGFDGTIDAKLTLKQAKPGALSEFVASALVDGRRGDGEKVKIDAGGTYVGQRFYVHYDGVDYDLGEQLSKRATASLLRAAGQADRHRGDAGVVGQLGLHPERWMSEPRIDGEDQIGGVDTYKIVGDVNAAAFVPDVLTAARKVETLTGTGSSIKVPALSTTDAARLAKGITKLDVQLWTGKRDHVLRQLSVDLSLRDGDETLSGKLKLTLTGVNEPQQVVAPSDTKPMTELMPKLSGLLGDGEQGAASDDDDAVPDAYVSCVNAAGGDAAKLNACQAEL